MTRTTVMHLHDVKKAHTISIRKKIKSYFSKRREVLAVYLFGSQATGAVKAWSDVDVGVLIHPEFKKRASELEFKYRFDLEKILESDVDIAVLNGADLFLVQQILTKGIRVFVRGVKRAEELTLHLLKLSWDFMPLKRVFDDAAQKRLEHGY